jgi:hypothetical protein
MKEWKQRKVEMMVQASTQENMMPMISSSFKPTYIINQIPSVAAAQPKYDF